MQKLHLVGFTTDQQGLILSARRGARSGSFQLQVDETLAEVVEELRAKQAEAARSARVESTLSVREVQARLRQGRTVADVAKAAGVEPGWVERFAAPVFAERAQVISKVRGRPLRRARLGPSVHPIGDAIQRNLAGRNVTISPQEFTDGWSARQLADGRWAVRFRYRHRNRDQVLRYDLDEADGTVVAADRASGLLGYVTPPAPRPPPSPRPRPTAKRATVTTGFRPDDAAAKPTSRPAKERQRANVAMRKAVTKRAADAERATARRDKEKQQEAVRREREARAEDARKARARAAAERAKAAAATKKAAAAKKRAAERARAKAAKQVAEQARRAEVALRAAERKPRPSPANGAAPVRPSGTSRTGPLRAT